MKPFQKILIFVMAVQIGFCAVADAAPKRTFWEKFWCGDLTTSNATRERRIDVRISTLKSATSSFYDSLKWDLVQLETLTQYIQTLKEGVESGLILARNADTQALAQAFRQKFSLLSRNSISIEDFEKGADYVIKKRSELAAKNPKLPFDPEVVEKLKIQYRYYQSVLIDYPFDVTVIAKELFFDVNDLAFQAELAGIQNTIQFDVRFKGVVSLADGIPGKARFVSTMKFFGKTSLSEKIDQTWWAGERLRQWSIYLGQLRGSSVEKQALEAFRAVNYEAMKYIFMGPVSRAGEEMDLKAFASLIDELTRFVRNRTLNRTDEYWKLLEIVKKTESGLADFSMYTIYDSKYHEKLKLLYTELKKRTL